MGDIECAFPANEKSDNGSHHHSHLGMTLRDYFAAHAVIGLLGRAWYQENKAGTELTALWARAAYVLADAMIQARKS